MPLAAISPSATQLRLPGPTPRRSSHLPAHWAILCLFGGLFIWWVLGVGGFIQVVFAAPMLVALAVRGRTWMPRSYWVWLLFLAWMFLSAVQIEDFERAVAFAWRGLLYLGATITFLYVFNLPREIVPARRFVNALAGFWVLTVVGGILSMAFPGLSFTSLMDALLPDQIASQPFVHALITPSTTGSRAFTGTGIFRVKAPFIYTNQWGSAFALTLPFALATLGAMRAGPARKALIGLLVISIIPLIFSLDRGSWLSAGAAVAYGGLRLASRTRERRVKALARTLRVMIVAGVVVVGLVLLTPLGDLVLLRWEKGYGDQHRSTLYSSSIVLIKRSPLLGYGGTVELSAVDPNAPPGPSVGTHGQLWTVMISNGIPALVFFVGWLLIAFLFTRRRLPPSPDRDDHARFWANVAIFAAIVQLPYYELLPWGLFIVMVAAAVAWRESSFVPFAPVWHGSDSGRLPSSRHILSPVT
jgi:hypothetical protein